MSTFYWISQILVVLAYIFLGIGMRKKNKIELLLFSLIYNFLIIIHFVLLGGIMGIVASIIGLARNILFIFNEKNKQPNPIWILLVFSAITIFLTVIFYEVFTDILPCILTLVGIFSYWCKGTKITRIGTFIISMCYIFYAIPLHSWISIICETYIIMNTIFGYLKHNRET